MPVYQGMRARERYVFDVTVVILKEVHKEISKILALVILEQNHI